MDMKAAVEQGNALLSDSEASAADLEAAYRQIRAVSEVVNGQELPNPAQALSFEDRDQLEANRREALAERQILANVADALDRRLKAARRQEAVAGADDGRAALDKALAAAERAADKAAQAREAAHAELERLGRAKADAGSQGRGAVGCSDEQLDRLFALGGLPSDLDKRQFQARYQAGY